VSTRSNTAARHRGVGRALVFGVTSVLPKGTKFDPAEASHGVLRGDFDRLVTADAFEKVEAAQPFPRLGERTIGYQHLALAPTNGGGLVRAFETRAEASYVRRSISSTQSLMLSSSGTYVSAVGSL
jgi:hypothetical protein